MAKKSGTGRTDDRVRRENERNPATPSPSTPFQLLTPAQVAGMLQIPVKSVHALCRAGKLGYYWINGKERRFDFSDIEAYKAACRVETKAENFSVSKASHSLQTSSPPHTKSPVDTARPVSLPSRPKGGDNKRSRKKLSRESVEAEFRKELREW
ncbi:helix-turn-helix domain-containing protein [Desulfomonile tiedjei]|uniref:Helix-turn-helix domain-containing protein n=1 Tax=Desulfomonile tiedjei (strain ATCC 49306 / DSM 6799 / DCB-1) TaxID=706587 RepID=I4C8Y0_DESTA|nr:helix-turn-helix domain-containing protein [Desulfomonile tiedjei]AFM26021.1 hypothetical protein Desti_3366 [Desulfomonile tiedjei DSM 6799]